MWRGEGVIALILYANANCKQVSLTLSRAVCFQTPVKTYLD